jgi:hypothetical protein
MDVISNERERDDFRVLVRRRPAAGWGVPLTAGLALVAAVCGFLVGRLEASGGLFGKGSVGDLTGSMVLELQDGAYVEAQGLTDQIQYRGEDWRGRSPSGPVPTALAPLACRARLRTCRPTPVPSSRTAGVRQR